MFSFAVYFEMADQHKCSRCNSLYIYSHLVWIFSEVGLVHPHPLSRTESGINYRHAKALVGVPYLGHNYHAIKGVTAVFWLTDVLYPLQKVSQSFWYNCEVATSKRIWHAHLYACLKEMRAYKWVCDSQPEKHDIFLPFSDVIKASIVKTYFKH